MYQCIMLVMCASIFFNFLFWVTLPRAAQLLIYVPPNEGNLTANFKVCRDNLVKSLFCQLETRKTV
jgi:hypothetical protein